MYNNQHFSHVECKDIIFCPLPTPFPAGKNVQGVNGKAVTNWNGHKLEKVVVKKAEV